MYPTSFLRHFAPCNGKKPVCVPQEYFLPLRARGAPQKYFLALRARGAPQEYFLALRARGAPLGFFVTSDKEPKRRKAPMVP